MLALAGTGLACAPTAMRTPVRTEPEMTPAQRAYRQLGYGMFLHFGPTTLEGLSLGSGRFPAAQVDFPRLDCRQWARVAVAAGMKYAVLTAKHVDGFCLWPTAHSQYCTKNTPSGRDIVREFVEAFREVGLQVGLYYALWDKNAPMYNDDASYAAYVRAQIEELLTGYGPMVELWFDGAWDKDFPSRDWLYEPEWENDPNSGLTHGEKWQFAELYQHVHRLSPNCLVVNNSASDRGGLVRYLPADIRTAERIHFAWGGKMFQTTLAPDIRDATGKKLNLPLELCDTITPGWFWNRRVGFSHMPPEGIAAWMKTAAASDANLLLNIGPDDSGRIPDYHEPFLVEAKRLRDLG